MFTSKIGRSVPYQSVYPTVADALTYIDIALRYVKLSIVNRKKDGKRNRWRPLGFDCVIHGVKAGRFFHGFEIHTDAL